MRHPTCTLHIVPAMNLGWSSLLAFRGAEYHLFQIKRLLAKPAFQTAWESDHSLDGATRQEYEEEQNVFDYHLRGIFWELVATFDTILQWANLEFGLGLDERNVRWKTVAKSTPTKKTVKWPHIHDRLKNIWESNWYFEIRSYRNFSHISHNFWQRDVSPSGLNCPFLLPAHKGQPLASLPDRLNYYVDDIREIGRVGDASI